MTKNGGLRAQKVGYTGSTQGRLLSCLRKQLSVCLEEGKDQEGDVCAEGAEGAEVPTNILTCAWKFCRSVLFNGKMS